MRNKWVVETFWVFGLGMGEAQLAPLGPIGNESRPIECQFLPFRNSKAMKPMGQAHDHRPVQTSSPQSISRPKIAQQSF